MLAWETKKGTLSGWRGQSTISNLKGRVQILDVVNQQVFVPFGEGQVQEDLEAEADCSGSDWRGPSGNPKG